mmetsp:Transcript_112027/g.317209  ORF Transcript_112027/g.317209 Transcript_112027/m.317209 type:complete len:408 (+) Transcript_112027:41-1264(+)
MNFRAGRVVRAPTGDCDRFGVQLLPPGRGAAPKLLKRMNLLDASSPRDRELFLALQTLNSNHKMRVVRPALNALLQEDYGLLLLISSYVTHPRKCLFQFGGYKGKIWDENWSYANPARPLPLEGRPSPRLDAASSDMGLGRALFAGGCGAHPRLCAPPEGFFKSAAVYDSLTDEWAPIADMPTRRHGAAACLLDRRVYVLGGMYVDDRAGRREDKFCDVLDVDTMRWSSVPPGHYDRVRGLDIFDHAAFFGAGVAGSRIVALLSGVTIAYNPSAGDGWRVVEADCEVRIGESSVACTYRDELVVASGRPPLYGRCAAAFSFRAPASDPDWWRGSWRQLPDLNAVRVGASMAVVQGRLYITGGVDETTGQFSGDAERLEGDAWARVPWFEMPRALHAHDTFPLPYLDR